MAVTVDPTSPPEPTVDDLTALAAQIAASASAIAAVFVLIGVIVFGAMLLKASRYPWPVPIIAPLAMLTLVFGLAGLVNTELVPLAGAGIGALAGVLTTTLGRQHRPLSNMDNGDRAGHSTLDNDTPDNPPTLDTDKPPTANSP